LSLQLLDEGADIHAIGPKRQSGGSALAEAIAGKHEALVELLLRYGADPFTENPAGKTPLDLALEARAVNIVRACERQALFAGYVSTRVSTGPVCRWVRDRAIGGARECMCLGSIALASAMPGRDVTVQLTAHPACPTQPFAKGFGRLCACS
jgi:hypothetical protein